MAADDERRAEIEAVARALAGDDQGPWYAFEEDAEKAIAALDRVRDAQGDDEGAHWREKFEIAQRAERAWQSSYDGLAARLLKAETDDERRAEIEAEELATALKQHFAPQDVGYGRMPVTAHAIDLARWFLDRVRDARGNDEGLPDCEHGYFAAGGTDTCPACDADALDYLEQRKAEAARSPQSEDHEAGIEVCARGPRDDDAEKLDALGSYLEQYPPAGFADRYSADGWRHIARGVLSAATIFFAAPSPSRDGTVAVEDVVAWLQHIDRLDEIAGAKVGLPKYNPLWDAAEAIRIVFGGSLASTGDREGPNPGTGHGQ